MILRRLSILFLLVFLGGCSNPKKSSNFDCPNPVGTIFDADADMLTDLREGALGTNPSKADSDGDGFSDYVEVSAGTDPLSASSAPSAQIARVKQITAASELIGGPAAVGQVGDWLLENDEVRAIVQRHDAEQMQIGTYGGNLIDVDVVRPIGEPGNDTFGMVIPVISLSVTTHPEKIEILADGSDGGAAILRACGGDDTFEYLDLQAIVSSFGLGIGYDSNADQPIRISNDYILAPGSRTVEIVTTIGNEGATMFTPIGDILDSGTALEIFNTNQGGFGGASASISSLVNQNSTTNYMAFLSPESSWGYVPDGDPNQSLTLFGVTIFMQGFDTALGVLASDPDPDDGVPGLGMNRIGRGKRFSYHRALVVSDGAGAAEPFNAEYQRRHAPTAVLRSGTVADGAGVVGGARIVALSFDADAAKDRLPLVVTESDAAGNYSMTLPAGTFRFAADLSGRGSPVFAGGTAVDVETRGDTNLLPMTEVALGATGALPDITFPDAGHLAVTVTNVSGGLPVASRLTVVGADPTPEDGIFRDQKDRVTSSIPVHRIAQNGVFLLDIEPGDYDVYVSRGLEWSLGSAMNMTVTAGATATANLQIGRVVDTVGWISADFHVHMANSPDSPTPLADRIVNASAEGLDVIVPTDHDYVTDLQPLITSMGLSSSMSSTPGVEISPTNYGHFISYPLVHDGTRADGGAYKWSGGAGAISNRTPAQIFEDIEAAHPGVQVSQVCHPRGSLTGHYTAIDADMATLASKTTPELLRIPSPAGATPADTKLFYPSFDSQEVLNGAGQNPTTTNKLMNDYFALLSAGLTLAAIGDSDTHSVFSGQLGWPRNYVQLANDDPAQFPGQADALAQAVKDGKTFFTSGPFIQVIVTGDDTGGPGSLVLPFLATSTVDLTVSVYMPDWIAVDTLEVYLNTPNTAAPSGTDGIATAPVPQLTQPITLFPQAAGLGLTRMVSSVTLPVTVPATGDAWLVVVVRGVAGRSLYPIIPEGGNPRPLAMASAVYLDGNRNGAWNPPGQTFTAAFRRPDPLPKVHRYDVKEITPETFPSIREQFERLSEGNHFH